MRDSSAGQSWSCSRGRRSATKAMTTGPVRAPKASGSLQDCGTLANCCRCASGLGWLLTETLWSQAPSVSGASFFFLLRIVHRRLVTRCQLSLQPNQSGRKIRFQPANKSAGEISLDLFLSGSALRGEGSCALRLRRRHFPRQFLWADFELPIATGYWDSGTLQMLSPRVSKQKELPSRSSIAFPRPRNQTGTPTTGKQTGYGHLRRRVLQFHVTGSRLAPPVPPARSRPSPCLRFLSRSAAETALP